ncbi:DEAD/DEAH box helicase [Myroides marinus]|uniref:DEAD/DEAH box helicase n=1 Tax=Myroides marinus TaxID=703342 RepID=UPI0025755662|nr:DEAD/DEAH box helicase [Myroides marinus]MDM1346025.1 DEAD/DEAH box helicase [Myroides marinus]
MLDKILLEGQFDSNIVTQILNNFHVAGPVDSDHLETLAYIKEFRPEQFHYFENKLMFLMGLFYKTSEPLTFFDQVYSDYANAILEQTGRHFTPVQADAYSSIQKFDNFSFSAPTSAGKSYLYQELIKDIEGDMIIVVPSRALLSEYLIKVQDLVPNEILVLPFIDFVNTRKTTRRIFIITPERGDDLFKYQEQINLELVLFDEAQLSEEGIRGMKFDSLVRRIEKKFTHVKKVFTHPFVINPEAQLQKHNLQNGDAEAYDQKTVGKIFVEYRNNIFKYFSPYNDKSQGKLEYSGDIISDSIANGKTALIYISKTQIYNETFLETYSKYIALCKEITDPRALEHIEELKNYFGEDKEKKSLMLLLMRVGIVIHHGSIPLKARTIIERFVNENHAQICFSTSTLIQGINMPFDLVWINNFRFTGNEDQKKLSLKNLIGRAGRTTKTANNYDYGYVIINSSNKNKFIKCLKSDSYLETESILDSDGENVNEDYLDVIDAIKNDTFDTNFNLTNDQIERLNSTHLDQDIDFILSSFIDAEGAPLSGRNYHNLNVDVRRKIRQSLANIFISHLRRSELTRGEKAVLDTAIPILLWQIQGKSFSEIVSLRYSYLSERDFRRALRRDLKNGEISRKKYQEELLNKQIRFSCIAETLPNSRFPVPIPLFGYKSVTEIDFDLLIYDTYDYIDKVLSLSLKDPLSAAFELYYNRTSDVKALSLSNYIRYGTNDSIEIWLLRYGFIFEDIEWVKPYILEIDENEIKFKDSISGVFEDSSKFKSIERYL